tara:strand:+ start:192 stop:908 length:717 start_codon:yes stop_codon:yes gene_type:complete
MKVLILGDGLLGTEVAKQTGWDIISRKKDKFDITDKETFSKITKVKFGVAQYCPYDIILNCIANTDTYSDDKKLHWDVNYKGVSNLVNFCNRWKLKLVHISTEFVYANNIIPPTEIDLPLPDNTWYAYTKLLADEYIKLNSLDYLICRELHKPSPFPYDKVWDLVLTSGDTVDKITDLIIKLIKGNAYGIYNVGTGDKSLANLAPDSRKISPPNVNIPRDTRMNIKKLNKFLKINYEK